MPRALHRRRFLWKRIVQSGPGIGDGAPGKDLSAQSAGDALEEREDHRGVVKLILSWRHSGFNVHFGPRIQPDDKEAMENLARYVVRASFSQERMTYLPDESQVLYRSKDGKNEKTFDALE